MATHINDGLSPPILWIDELGFIIAIAPALQYVYYLLWLQQRVVDPDKINDSGTGNPCLSCDS